MSYQWIYSYIIRKRAQVVGSNNEYLFSSRLDDLECAYICVDSLIKANNQI